MPFLFLGIAPRVYPQYADTDRDAPLQPEPGGAYSMAPVAGHEDLAVPPQDGLWGTEIEAAPEPPAEAAAPAKTTKKAAAAAEQGA